METNPPSSVSVSLKRNAAAMDDDEAAASAKRVRSDEPPPDHPHSASPVVKAQAVMRTVEFALKRSPSSSVPAAPAEPAQLQADPPPPATTTAAGPTTAAHDPDIDAAFRAAVLAKLAESSSGSSAPSTASTRTGPLPSVHDPSPVQKAEEEEEDEEETDDPDAERSDGGWDDEDEWVPPVAVVAGNSSSSMAPEPEQPSANGQSLISPPPTPVPTVRTDAASPLPPTIPAPPPEPTPDVATAIAADADVDLKSGTDDAAPAPDVAEHTSPAPETEPAGDVDDDWLEAVAPSNFALPDESFWAPPTSPPTLTAELSPLTQASHSLVSSPPPISALLNPPTDPFHPSTDAFHPSTGASHPSKPARADPDDDDDEYADSGDELNAALADVPVAPGFVSRGSDGAKVQCAACGKWMAPSRTAGHVARLCGTLPDPERGRKAKRRSTSVATPKAARTSARRASAPSKPPRIPKPRKEKPEKVSAMPAARLAARRAELDADRWAAQVDDARGVRCAACGAWVDVGGAGLGAVQRWSGRTGHKSVCAQVVETVRREEAEAKLRELTHAHEAPAPVPPAILADRRVRRIDGDQAQCDVCGVWTLFKNWDAHQGVRCEQIRARRDAKAARRDAKAARRASKGAAYTSTSVRGLAALSDLSSDSEFETRRDVRWVGGPGAKLRAEALEKAAAAAAAASASGSGAAGASGSGSGAVGAGASASGSASTAATAAASGASASTTAAVSAPTAVASTSAIPTAASSGSASLATTANTVSVAVPAAATAKGASTAKATATSTSTPKAATTSAATNGTASAAKKAASSAAGSASKAASAAAAGSGSRLAHPWPTLVGSGALPAGVPRPWMTDPRYGLGVIPPDMLQKMYPGFMPAGYMYDPAQAAKGKGKAKAAAPPRAAASSSTLRPELLSATISPFPMADAPKAAPAPASGKRAAGPSAESPAAKKAKAEAGPPKKKTLPLASILAEAEARADAAAAAAATAGPSTLAAASSSAPAAPSATKKPAASPTAATPRVAVAPAPKRYGGVIELPKAAKAKFRAARQAEIAREAAQRSAGAAAAEADAAPVNTISDKERKEWSNAPQPYARKSPGARVMQLYGKYRLCGLKVSVSSLADRNTRFEDDLPTDPEQLLRYERQVILHYDADVARVGEDNTVQCKGCSSWVKLPTSGAPTKKWYGRTGHKACCQGNIERRQAVAAQPVAEAPEVIFHKPFRIRRVKGDKVQCAGCGKNVSAPMWARHLDERCTFYTVPPAGPKPDSSDSDSEAFESWMSAQAATNGKPQLPLDVTIAKRRAQLLEDAAVREIGDDKLLCDPCGQWIKISKHLYAEHKWYGGQGHRDRCVAQHPSWKPRADKDELTPSPATSVPGSPAKPGSSAATAASKSLAVPLRPPTRPTEAPPSSPPSVIVIPDTSSDHEVHDDDEEYNPDEDDSGAESESSEDPELDV